MSPPPAIDHHLETVSIPRRLVSPLLAVHAGTAPSAAELRDLRAGGLVGAAGLHPLVRSLVEVMTDPSLVVTVETKLSRSSPPLLATFWRHADVAVVGSRSGRRNFDLARIDPHLLPFHIAQFVGLVPRPQPRFDDSVQILESALAQAEQHVATDPVAADAALAAAGVPPVWIDRLLAALTLRRSTWVVESLWLGGGGRDESRLCVLDSGFAGYWRMGNTGQGRITVSPTGFDDVLERIAALLP